MEVFMIIGILGFIGSGKGTVANILQQEHNFKTDSFASSLKDACAAIFDWPRDLLEGDTIESRTWREVTDEWWAQKLGISNFTPRLALQLIGTDSLRNHFHQDIWFLTLQNRLRKNPDADVVISDVRFPNEVQMVKDMGGILIQVVRGDDPVWFNIAKSANAGDEDALRDMKESFPEVHFSEWAWVSHKTHLNAVISNNGSLSDLSHNVTSLLEKYK